MEETITFFNNFIAEEYKFLQKLNLERDSENLKNSLANIRHFFDADFHNFYEHFEYNRPTNPKESFFEDGQMAIDKGWTAERTLF